MPGDKADGMDCEEMLKAASKPFSQCGVHAAEMIEKNIACLSCNRLVCALCMRDSHLSHDIISVNKLRDCMSLREKVADDLNELQVLQKRLQTQMEDRKKTQKEIELSNKKMCAEIDGAFEQLQSVLHDKKEEIKKYLTTYHEKNLDNLKLDLKALEEKYTNSTRMIQKVITCTTKPHGNIKEMLDLPQQLKSMVEQSQLLSSLDNVDLLMAENKFSKVLPSLEAVANICQTLHPEATKVVWSKVTPEKKDNGTFSSSLKRKSSSALKTLKRLKSSSSPKPMESAAHPGSLPEPTPGAEASTQPDTPAVSKSATLIKTPNSPATASGTTPATPPAATVAHSPSTVLGTARHAVEQNTRLPDSTGTPDVSASASKEYKLINLELLRVVQGNFVMGLSGVELQIGKVLEVTQLHSLHFVSVQWYQGSVGKSKQFTLSEKWIKKSDLVNSEGLICSFTFDPLQPITDTLEKELIRAGEEFNINGSSASPWAKRVRTAKTT
ncbi:tripartite motif-containing protein 55-like isoform X2 [Haliotis cracherodii]|uniref:tripartite motif-containing protein 55-like isoform X2 n=1 Tax=Haliotis cracherodii TaxID=6455 RepID=UPI0039E8CF96